MSFSGSFLRALAAGALALSLAGCDRVVFGWLNRGQAGPATTVEYAPDVGLSLDVFEPPAGTHDAPVVVFFYGGAWRNGTREQYRFVGSRLAPRGMLVVVADYRTFPRAVFPAFVDDGARAVAWAHANARAHGGDPRRVFVVGHSAGAHIAALLATDARYLARHGLAPCALAGAIGLAGPYKFDIEGELAPIFGARSQWPDALPLAFVDGDEPPFLVIHGDADERVDARNGPRMAEALRAHGVAVRLEMLPGGKHRTPLAGIYRPERYPEVLPMIERFVREMPAAACLNKAGV
jgi:acetyl esterase/lipase